MIKSDLENTKLLAINFIEKDDCFCDYTSYSEKIKQVISNYKSVKNVQTTVDTKIVMQKQDSTYSCSRRSALKEKDILSKQIEEWLQNGVIQASTSKLAIPVMIVSKKNVYTGFYNHDTLAKPGGYIT
ncbi:hypothetical protein WN48_04417 [Eufriesea mexicana]|uniref:Uncharacterized protein n=1 Tax=Eufriesea mexicana TaxID=516756 RepID=A0A310SE86_9HYME|nr:hypothetical protein WN48_04417 [Eufriesea mexicana]